MNIRTHKRGLLALIAGTSLSAACLVSLATAAAERLPSGTPLPAPAASPAPPAAEADAVTLATIEVESTDYDPRRDDVATRIVVSREELLRYGDVSLIDAMKRLPGITVRPGSGGQGGAIALRGMSRYTQVLVDGERMSAGFSLESLTPDMVERVEIQRSATADLRTEAIAGTVNIILRKAASKDTRQLKVFLSGAPGQLRPSASWYGAGSREGRSYSMTTSLRRQAFLEQSNAEETGRDASGDPLYQRTGTTRVLGDRDALAVAPRFSLDFDNGGSLSGQAFLDVSRYEKRGDSDWVTQQGLEPAYTSYFELTALDLMQLRTSLAWEQPFDSGARLVTKLSLYGNREDFELSEQGTASAGRPDLMRSTASDLAVDSINSTGKYSFPVSDEHTPELGWELGQELRREDRVLVDGSASPVVAPGQRFDARVRRVAGYVQDEWTISKRLSVYLGARWEQLRSRSTGSTFATVQNKASVLSPIMQALWKPKDKGGQVRMAFSRSYKAPELRLLVPRPYLSIRNNELEPDFQGNPLLAPELAWGLDLSYEHFWDNSAMFSVGAFARSIDGIVRSQTRLLDGRWVSSPINGGDALTWGVEMDGKLPLKKVLPSAPALDLGFSLARNWSRIDDIPGPDNRIGDQPAFSATVTADYPAHSRLTLGGSYRFTSYGERQVNLFQRNDSAPSRSLDVYGAWRISSDARLRVSISNLLDEGSTADSRYLFPDGSRNLRTLRDLPRTFSLGFEYDL